jgi:hypothetical protein
MLAPSCFPARFTRALTLICFCLVLAGAVQATEPTPLVLQGLGRTSLPVGGTWQFHEGDDLAWASPTFDDSGWQPMEVGRTWEEQGHHGLTGFAWYRRRLLIPSGENAGYTLGLYLPQVDSAAEIYWNGVKVGDFGKLPPHPVWYGGEVGTTVLKSQLITLGQAHSGVLAIRVWKAPTVFLAYPNEGGLITVPQIGSVDAIASLQLAARYRVVQESQLIETVGKISAIVGLMALLLWLRNRKQSMLLWLSLAMIMPFLRYQLLSGPQPPTMRFFYALIGPLIAIDDLAIWFLLIALLGLTERKWLVRWTWIVALTALGLDLIDTTCMLFDWTTWPHNLFLKIDIASATPAIYLELWGLVIVFAALGKRLDAARWILAIAALLSDLLTAMGDITGLGQRWTHWTLSPKLHATLITIDGNPIHAGSIVNTFLLISMLYAAWRYSLEQGERQNALEQEYRSAQELQRVLIPESMPTLQGYVVKGAYRPAQEVGGDFFQVIPLQNDAALVVVGDVSGKGLHAAMTVALIVGAIRSTVEITEDPATILTSLNRRLHGRLHNGFATCLAVKLERSGTCVLANAGHLPPYLNTEEVQSPPALPLGLVPAAEYDEVRFQLTDIDRLTLYTDGLLEARNAAGELFGFARIAELLGSTGDADKIADTAQRFGQDDDITVLTVAMAMAPAEVAVRSAQWATASSTANIV